MVNLNIPLPDELHKKLKIKAAVEDQSLKQLIATILDTKSERQTK